MKAYNKIERVIKLTAKIKMWLAALTLLITAVLSACGSGGSDTGKSASDAPKDNATPPPAAQKPKDPVTLTFYSTNANENVEMFMEQYGNPIQKKFPHITIKLVSPPSTAVEDHITGMLSAGETIDVFLNADINHYRLITPFKLEYDMTNLIKTNNFDLNRLDPSTVQAVRNLSKGGMYALPYSMNTFGLMYNKDLFDKFGVPYPKDGMTWDEIYDKAKQMTRNDGGTQYRGFVTQSYNFAFLNQMSLGFVDPKTDKALFYSDERWAKFTRNLLRFYEIPGNELKEGSFGGVSGTFLKDKIMAMYAYFIPTTKQDVNWDVVSLPEFSDLRGVGTQPLLWLAYIPSISKNKEAAFEAIAYMTSDEYQTHIAKKALGFPVITTQSVKDSYGQDNPHLQGKNVKALLKNKPALPPVGSQYSRTAGVQFERIMYQLGKGQLDMNTALRQMEENANKDIEKAKSGQ